MGNFIGILMGKGEIDLRRIGGLSVMCKGPKIETTCFIMKGELVQDSLANTRANLKSLHAEIRERIMCVCVCGREWMQGV